MNIENKTILITGANRGIGRALVEEALKKGAKRVYAATRQPFTQVSARLGAPPFSQACREPAVTRMQWVVRELFMSLAHA